MKLDLQQTWFVGVDTHKFEHTATAIDAFHQPQAVVTVENTACGFEELVAALESAMPAGRELIFGLEDTQGLGRPLAQWLVSRGYTVLEVNPIYTDRDRGQHPDPDKSDRKDARAIAEVLYRHRHELPVVRPDGRRKALQQVVQAREQLVRQRTSIKNQLHVLLHDQYPHYRQFFSDPFGAAARAFFHAFPSPGHLQGRGVTRLGAFLKKQASCLGEQKAAQLLALIDKKAVRDQSTDARDVLIRSLLDQLKALEEQLAVIEAHMAELLAASEYQLRSMPGLGDVLAASLEAEIGAIERFASADKLARYAGVAPAEASSGSRKRHHRNKTYGRRRLNAAFYRLALSQIQCNRNGCYLNPEARRYYEKKLSEGKSSKAALRCLMRRLVDIIYAIMRDRSAYRLPERDSTLHSKAV